MTAQENETKGATVARCEKRHVLHLVLTFHSFDETAKGRNRIEYRRMDSAKWQREIWDRRGEITHVEFHRGMTRRTCLFVVDRIDIGPCPIEGWDGEYYRIHFS